MDEEAHDDVLYQSEDADKNIYDFIDTTLGG